jgi:hypothetical protein
MGFIDRIIARLDLVAHDPKNDQPLIDFLLLLMTSDGRISFDEQNRINIFILSRKWPVGHNPEMYVQKSLAKIRSLETDVEKEAFEQEVLTELSRSPHGPYLRRLCQEMAEIDELVTPGEASLLAGLDMSFLSAAAGGVSRHV